MFRVNCQNGDGVLPGLVNAFLHLGKPLEATPPFLENVKF